MEVANDSTRKRARTQRRRQTPADAALWKLLRGRALDGVKFRRQVAIGRFVVDFACYGPRLIVEADGGANRLGEHEDAVRDAWLRARGFAVLRFSNETILGDPDEVIRAVLAVARPAWR